MARSVVDGFLENQQDIAADVDADSEIIGGARRVEPQLDSRSVNSSSACCRILRVRSSRLSRFGLIAQTISLIELTDSRAIRAMDASGPSVLRVAGDLGEQRDPREIRSDIVVEVGGDPDPQMEHLQQPCDAVSVHRVRHAPRRWWR